MTKCEPAPGPHLPLGAGRERDLQAGRNGLPVAGRERDCPRLGEGGAEVEAGGVGRDVEDGEVEASAVGEDGDGDAERDRTRQTLDMGRGTARLCPYG